MSTSKTKPNYLIFSWIILVGTALSKVSFAREFRAKLIRDPKLQIRELRWDLSPETQMPVVEVRPEGIYFVQIKGYFEKKNSTLLYRDNQIAVQPDHSFELEVQVNSEKEQ